MSLSSDSEIEKHIARSRIIAVPLLDGGIDAMELTLPAPAACAARQIADSL